MQGYEGAVGLQSDNMIIDQLGMQSFPREQFQKDSIQYNLTTHLSFILQTLQFVVLKLNELSRVHSEHELVKKRSFIKIYDKNVERLPLRSEKMELPAASLEDKMVEITEMIEEYQKALPKVEISEFKKIHQLEYHVEKWLSELSDRIEDLSRRTQSIEVDMGDIILLYKDILLAH